MTTTRRSFFGWLAGAFAAPALPEIAQAMTAAPAAPAIIFLDSDLQMDLDWEKIADFPVGTQIRTRLPSGCWRKFYNGVPIEEVESLKS